MLLVVTNKTDLACDYLILYLNEREIPFLRINTEAPPPGIWSVAFLST